MRKFFSTLVNIIFDGRYEYSDVVAVYAEDKNSKEMTISPNPAYDVLHIQSKIDGSYHLYNVMAKHIQTIHINVGKNKIDI